LGVGGGAIIIPFLVYCNVPMKKAGGTSAGCTLPIAILGTIVFMLQSHAHMALPYSTGYIYWPALIGMGVMSALFAPFGAKLAKHTNVLVLKRIFAIFLLFVGINLIF